MNKLRFLVPALIASAVVAGNGNLGAMNSNSGDSSADTDTVIPADTIVPDTPDTIPPAPVEITGITVSPKSARLLQRESVTFNATLTPADAPADNLKWSVVPGNTSEYIQITPDGTSATVYVPDEVEKGNYKIVASAATGEVADTCMLIVEERATRITLNMRDINLFPGETVDNIQAYLYYKDGSYTSRGIKWSTSNTNIATVPSPGMVTGVAPGWAELIVSGGGQSLTGSIHVFQQLDTIYVTPEVLTMTYGETKQIKATLLPEAVANGPVRWELRPLNAPNVKIDKKGNITTTHDKSGIDKAQTVYVNAMAGNMTATCKVNIIVPVTSVVLSPTTATIEQNDSCEITATLSPEGAFEEPQWESSDPTVAIISNVETIAEGFAKVTATVKALNPGSAIISVKIRELSAISLVNVKANQAGVYEIDTDTYSLCDVYDTNGRPVVLQTPLSAVGSMLQKGIYIIKVNGNSHKISIR